MKYGISKSTNLSFEKVLSKVKDELNKEGFSIVTTIDVKDMMKKKLNLDFDNYTILGACNPPFAYQILEMKKEFGLFLPCNIVVYQDGSNMVVSAFDPMIAAKLAKESEIIAVAKEMKTRLERVINAI